ncbi:MAG TPA: hypothetical protein VM290_03355 [Gaiellaceae bacterium]|nr:hypothetical protein [Gaiellaceae bacterium]
MTRRRRLPLAAVAVAGAALAGALLGPRLLEPAADRSGAALAGDQAFAVRAAVVPDVHLFGDTVEARLEVAVDRRRVDPDDVRVEWRFAPYEQVGERRVARRDVGHVTHLAYAVALRCLGAECVPPRLASDAGENEGGRGERHRFLFPTARVSFGSDFDARDVPWPPVEVTSRINAAQYEADVRAQEQAVYGGAAASPRFRDDLTPAEPTWAVPPRLLASLALAGAALLLLVPGAQVAAAVRRRRRTPAEAWALLTPRERARLAAAWAAGRADASERRRALELAAAELGVGGDEALAARARELAWSGGAPPEPDDATALERDLSRRGNGAGA